MSALEGIRVVELSHDSTAFAGKLLADMGADVILIEPPEGAAARGYPPFVDDQADSERSLHWWHFNTSKRGVVLDLTDAADEARLEELLATADVLIEPGIARDYKALSARNPALIHAAISAFGQHSDRRDEPVTDLTLLAGGGPVWSCGYDDHSIPPIRGGGNQGYQTGCHYAVMAILTALMYRNQSALGQFIDVSITAALNLTTEAASYSWLVSQETVQRQTGRHAAESILHLLLDLSTGFVDGGEEEILQ